MNVNNDESNGTAREPNHGDQCGALLDDANNLIAKAIQKLERALEQSTFAHDVSTGIAINERINALRAVID